MNDACQYDDNSMLHGISLGDERAFNMLFERYRNQLFTYLYKVTKSKETAEEIVLDVFLKLWHGRQTVMEIENIEAFLFRVAHNKAIDFFRAAKRNQIQQLDIWNKMQDAVSSESADNKLLFSNTETAVDDAVQRLSPQRQKVFYLRHNHGLSYEEIARRLNLSSNTVRNHLAASIQFIREFLGRDECMLVFFLILSCKKNIF